MNLNILKSRRCPDLILRETNRRSLQRYFLEHAGHSLQEVTVAITLLCIVIVPMSNLVFSLTSEWHNERTVMALTIGQRYIEETLASKVYLSEDVILEDQKWRVEKRVMRVDGCIKIVVRVFYRRHEEPLVNLMTMRLL